MFAHVRITKALVAAGSVSSGAPCSAVSKRAEKKETFYGVTAAEGLERYLHTVRGVEAFFAEGRRQLIPLLDDLVQAGGKSGVEETIIGMAHRDASMCW